MPGCVCVCVYVCLDGRGASCEMGKRIEAQHHNPIAAMFLEVLLVSMCVRGCVCVCVCVRVTACMYKRRPEGEMCGLVLLLSLFVAVFSFPRLLVYHSPFCSLPIIVSCVLTVARGLPWRVVPRSQRADQGRDDKR